MPRARFENVIIVTRNTELDDLVRRFNTKAQARFYLKQAGQSFGAIEEAHDKHQAVLKKVLHALRSPRPRARYAVTTPTYVFAFLRRVLSSRGLDFLLRRASGGGSR